MSETKTMSSTKTTSTEQVRFLTVTAIGIALVYVFTWLINIRLPFAPQGGLIHLGNVPLFIFAILFGKKTGAIAGGVGMGLFDLLSGWTAWAPFTFVIVGCMGFVMGWITEKKQGFQWYVVAMLAAWRDQDRRILHRRGNYLRQLDYTGDIDSGQPASDRNCSCDRSYHHCTVKESSCKTVELRRRFHV